jgi:3-hydroxybutyrate dehydrogenase
VRRHFSAAAARAAGATVGPLAGRTALVTGSTSGIGRAIAVSLASSGANVVLHGLASAADAQALRREFQGYGVKVAVGTQDVSTAAGTAELAALAATEVGPVDILVRASGRRGGGGGD